MISIKVHKSLDELKSAIDPKILPEEYGGEIPLCEMIGMYVHIDNHQWSFIQRENERQFQFVSLSSEFQENIERTQNSNKGTRRHVYRDCSDG